MQKLFNLFAFEFECNSCLWLIHTQFFTSEFHLVFTLFGRPIEWPFIIRLHYYFSLFLNLFLVFWTLANKLKTYTQFTVTTFRQNSSFTGKLCVRHTIIWSDLYSKAKHTRIHTILDCLVQSLYKKHIQWNLKILFASWTIGRLNWVVGLFVYLAFWWKSLRHFHYYHQPCTLVF